MNIIKIPIMNESKLINFRILILFKPLFFNAFNSPLSNNLMNRNCEDNKKINGKTS